jgi:cytochrome c oxidase cbb3-type subunit 3
MMSRMAYVHRPRTRIVAMAAAVAVLLAAACQRDSQVVRGGATGDVRIPTQGAAAGIADTSGLPEEGLLARVAIGDIAGSADNSFNATFRSPYAGNTAAIIAGEETFVKMNCASCHGYSLKGGMGPNLTDTYWRYGGSPADIYKSIYEGRPQGMPAWGRALSPTVIWKVVAYIEAQGGAFPGNMADRARQGDLANHDTSSGSTMKGRNSAP